jgi:hypothetical protein
LAQSKNLFRLKDGLGPCLVDANTTQHLPLHGKLLQKIRHLYSGSEPIKGSIGEEVSLNGLQKIAEATSPLKYKKEEEEVNHSIHCE